MPAATDIAAILAQLTKVGATPQQIIAALSADFATTVGGFKAESKTAYKEAQDTIREFYEKAAKERGQNYTGAMNPLAAGAANLGVEDFLNSDLAKSWSTDQRYLTEAADTALAQDLSWYEKMGVAQQDLYNAMLIEMTAQLAMPKAPASGGGGGGGGGGRGGGGGGGSSKNVFDPMTGERLGTEDFKVNVGSDTKYYNPGFDQAIRAGLEGGTGKLFTPSEAAQLEGALSRAAGGGPVEIRKSLQAELDALMGMGYVDQETGRWVRPEAGIPGETPLEKRTREYNDRKRIQEINTLLDKTEQFDPNRGAVNTVWTMNEDGSWNANDLKGVPLPDDYIPPTGEQEDAIEAIQAPTEGRPTRTPQERAEIAASRASAVDRGYIPGASPDRLEDAARMRTANQQSLPPDRLPQSKPDTNFSGDSGRTGIGRLSNTSQFLADMFGGNSSIYKGNPQLNMPDIGDPSNISQSVYNRLPTWLGGEGPVTKGTVGNLFPKANAQPELDTETARRIAMQKIEELQNKQEAPGTGLNLRDSSGGYSMDFLTNPAGYINNQLINGVPAGSNPARSVARGARGFGTVVADRAEQQIRPTTPASVNRSGNRVRATEGGINLRDSGGGYSMDFMTNPAGTINNQLIANAARSRLSNRPGIPEADQQAPMSVNPSTGARVSAVADRPEMDGDRIAEGVARIREAQAAAAARRLAEQQENARMAQMAAMNRQASQQRAWNSVAQPRPAAPVQSLPPDRIVTPFTPSRSTYKPVKKPAKASNRYQ